MVGSNEIIKELDLVLNKDELFKLKKKLNVILSHLKFFIFERKIDADIFVGGSFAKGTIVKKSRYDIDVFVRFNPRYEDISLELKKIVQDCAKVMKIKYDQVHGSRDYYRIVDEDIVFEIIPVCKVKRPIEAKNVTDLSYFHVNYVKKNINKSIANEIIIAKTFLKASGCYGAESYIKGFSGYAVECLLLHYKKFDKMIKEFLKSKDCIIIDQAKFYRNKNEVIINMNASKTKGPIILVDPTWKERNVLAALSQETFDNFKKYANEYMKSKKITFFEERKIDGNKIKENAKKNKNEFLKFRIITEKQAGDIAGTKLKKFSDFLVKEIDKYFEIKSYNFEYDDGQTSQIYLTIEPRDEIIKKGPPKNIFEEKGILYTKIKINFSAKQFISNWVRKYQKKMNEMDILSFKIVE